MALKEAARGLAVGDCNTRREAIQVAKRALNKFSDLEKEIEKISNQQGIKGDKLGAIDCLIDCIYACITDIEQCPSEKYTESKAGESIRKIIERMENAK